MAKRKAKQKQVMVLSVVLVIALFVLIVCVFILLNGRTEPEIRNSGGVLTSSQSSESGDSSGDSSSIDDNSFADESSNTDSSSESSSDSSEAVQPITDPASALIGLSSTQLVDRLGGQYSDYGYLNGGYTIYNYDVCPSIDFVIAVDDDLNVLNQPLSAIIVKEGGKVTNDVIVGMTYSQMKTYFGDSIQPIEQDEENCMFAFIDATGYTITVEFEYSGGKSIQANILLK